MWLPAEIAQRFPFAAGSSGGARRVVGRFAADRNGSVLIEMSIVLLILVTMLIGVAELSQGITLQRRVVSAAASAADLLTRATPADDPLDTAELNSLRGVLAEIVNPGNGGADSVAGFGFKVTVFEVEEVNAEDDNGQPLLDEEGKNKKKKRVKASPKTYTCKVTGLSAPSVPKEIVTEVDVGGRIVLVQTRISFTSAFTFFIKDAINLDGSSYFIPRLDSELKLDKDEECTDTT